MTEYALPCVRCDKPLRNVDVGSTNQPEEGLAFVSYGHYGTTVFDPMNGTYLEISICDECLLALATDKRVLWGRDRAPAVVDGVVVGTVELRHSYSLVEWNPELDQHPQNLTLGWGGITPRDEGCTDATDAT